MISEYATDAAHHVSWMNKYKVSFYDASYLSVALELQAILVTADEKFAKKTRTIDRICLLKDINL